MAIIERYKKRAKHGKMDQAETLEAWFLLNERQGGDEVVQRWSL